jgi:hypothetical protein
MGTLYGPLKAGKLRTGKSKTKAGENRALPMDQRLWATMIHYRAWYVSEFGELRPEWYVFLCFRDQRKPADPTRPATTIKTAWQKLKQELKIDYRLHDTRHTMAVAGVPDQ